MSNNFGHIAIRVRLDCLAVCRICCEVHGSVLRTLPAAQSQELRQVCACVTAPPAETWQGYDFNKAVELCRCCGRRLLMSGLRLSEWFCEACITPVETINRLCECNLIPTGRHVLLREINRDGAHCDRLPEFAQRLGDYFDRVERLEAHSRRVVIDNLAHVAGSEADVPLTEYLAALPATVAASHDGVLALGRAYGVPEHLLIHCV